MRELYAAVLLEIVQTKPSIPHVNGDVEEAMKAAKEAQDNYDAFRYRQ